MAIAPVRPASVDYSGPLVSVILDIDVLDPSTVKTQPQPVSSIEPGFELVGGLLFVLATAATGLPVVEPDVLGLMEAVQMKGAAGAQSSSWTVGSHPSVSILR